MTNLTIDTSTAPTLGIDVFRDISISENCNLTIPSGSTGYNVSPWNEFKSVTESNPCEVPTGKTLQIFTSGQTLANLTLDDTNINWYAVQTGGTALTTTQTMVDGTTYYAELTCGNPTGRLAVTVREISEATQSIFVADVTMHTKTVADLVSTPTAEYTADWYTTPTGGTALASTTAITNGTYYVEQTKPSSSAGETVAQFRKTTQMKSVSNRVAVQVSINAFNTFIGTSGNWNIATNWSTGNVPTADDYAKIPDGKTISLIASGVCQQLEVEANGGLIISSTGKLTINKDLTQSGTLTISSDANNQGTLILKGNQTGAGEVLYKKYLNTNWNLVSSPVQGASISSLYPKVEASTNVTTKRALGVYKNDNQENNKWVYFDTAADPTPGSFISGKGYTIKKKAVDGAGTLDFKGQLHSNKEGVSYAITNTGDKFNTIGNPYTAFSDNNTLLNATGTSLSEKTAWIWDSTNGKYVTKNLTSNYKVSPGEALLLKVKVLDTVFTFSKANQEHKVLSQRQAGLPSIKLSLKNASTAEQTTVYYLENATTGFDNGYDSSIFDGVENSFAVYTQLITNNDGKNLAIQSLPNSNYEKIIIPVGVHAASGEEITFSAESVNLPNDINILLEDRKTNTFTSLLQNEAYTITPAKDLNGIGRFYVHTSSAALNITKFNAENVSIYKTDTSTLRIVGLEQGKNTVKLFSILGKQVVTTSFESNGVKDLSLPELTTGVYIVELQSKTGKLSKKIILE